MVASPTSLVVSQPYTFQSWFFWSSVLSVEPPKALLGVFRRDSADLRLIVARALAGLGGGSIVGLS